MQLSPGDAFRDIHSFRISALCEGQMVEVMPIYNIPNMFFNVFIATNTQRMETHPDRSDLYFQSEGFTRYLPVHYHVIPPPSDSGRVFGLP